MSLKGRLSLNWMLSFLLAVVVHVGVAYLMLQNWEDTEAIEVSDIQPYYIEAGLVSENPYEAKKAKETERIQKRRAESIRRQQLAKEKSEKEKQQTYQRQRLEEERLAELAAEKARQETRENLAVPEFEDTVGGDSEVSEEDRVEMESTLASAIMEEQAYRKAVTDDEKAMAYVSQIQREIVQNWSRPPSARNGMQALLRVFLVPTGEVVNVVVEESSGNDSFDRSAVLAVRKAERFQVPADSRQFERNFREFTVLFRPEDLRL